MTGDFTRIEENLQYMHTLPAQVMRILLTDQTTKKNIVWATEEYAHLGAGFGAEDEIYASDVMGITSVVTPRVAKSKAVQSTRVRGMAEVFTPSWVCNKQNNLIDDAWFERKNVFNVETEEGWETVTETIAFPTASGRTWQDYVRANRIEIACGEAPYLTSRYDAVTGWIIPVEERIGLLDRKLRVVSENTDSEPTWYLWAKKACKSVYAYDWQGDNVLLARENLLFAFIDRYAYCFGKSPKETYLIEIAKILSWNVFQMDGLRFVVPNSCKPVAVRTETLMGAEVREEPCPGCRRNDPARHNGVYCRTYDWSARRSVEFYSTFLKEKAHNGTV